MLTKPHIIQTWFNDDTFTPYSSIDKHSSALYTVYRAINISVGLFAERDSVVPNTSGRPSVRQYFIAILTEILFQIG